MTQTFPFTEEGATAALEALGPDPAEALRQLGIRGWRKSDCSCPIARYVRAVVDEATTVFVFLQYDTRGDLDGGFADLVADDTDGRAQLEVDLPPVVTHFVAAFDDGAYVDLEGTSDVSA